MKGIIDRFEGNYAVVELQGGKTINIDKRKLPIEAQEGTVIEISESITIDNEETLKRKKEIEKLTEGLWDE
ncbi:DUF3006 domain-containing protein [Clostridium sp. FP2]|uniref:DUF3006 domain-containing protein n=1 Tax=Clostridium TaxID=1485 RepID=UPI0013E90258|nr:MULTISPECIES: DUF3006 domain-containing protein [Clostridium]MBW9156062.1 DUF3006 domain-containing protein [Clostridium tagluense]MBZ9625965.1 DUF3006 domain-containing protein [Clostridium sp. FP2]WLC65696.1 DUF3006 domain-containing protein [Clostridium tagluense]